MKQAKIVFSHVDYQTNRVAIRAGKNGKGREIWSCGYWFASEKSVEKMNEMLGQKISELVDYGFVIFDEDY